MGMTAFLFEGPCDGEVMQIASDTERIEIAVMDTKQVHVYHAYSHNIFGGAPCTSYKFLETIEND